MSGSTNSKIKNQNKQVEKQYKFDSEFYKFTNYENQRRYDDAVLRNELQQANLDAQRKFNDQTAIQRYTYEKDLQQRQYDVDSDAYNQALLDYDDQVALNSAAGALAQEAEDRRLDEALISKNFGIDDLNLNLQRADYNRNFLKDQNNDKVFFAEKQYTDDTAESASKRTFINEKKANDEAIIDERDKQADNTKDFLDDKSGWDENKVNRDFLIAQTKNYGDRIKLMVKREQDLGKVRARGREGVSAAAEQDSILAKYGRDVGELVDSMTRATETRTDGRDSVTTTRDFQKGLEDTKKNILAEEKDTVQKTAADLIRTSNYQDRKLKRTLDQLKAFVADDNKRLDDEYTFKKDQIERDKNKIKTTYDSAKLQYEANVARNELEEYGANLTALGRVPQKPKVPVPLPVPLASPKTKLPMPMEPTKGPKPIKGAMGKTSIWNDVGDVANVALQIVPFLPS